MPYFVEKSGEIYQKDEKNNNVHIHDFNLLQARVTLYLQLQDWIHKSVRNYMSLC